MDSFKEIERQLIDKIGALLYSFNSQFKALNIQVTGPSIEVWKSAPAEYESEINVNFYKDGNLFDVIENHVFRAGKQVASVEKFEEWFKVNFCDLINENKENQKVSSSAKRRDPGKRIETDNINQLYTRFREIPFPIYGKQLGDFVLYDSLLAGYIDGFSKGEQVNSSEIPVPDEETAFTVKRLRDERQLTKDERDFLNYFDILEELRHSLIASITRINHSETVAM